MPTNLFERDLIRKDKDILDQENSQLIIQSLNFSQELQSHINALQTDVNALESEMDQAQTDINIIEADYLKASNISNVDYNQSTWNGVTTIAPSKNVVRDKFESLTSFTPPIGTIMMYSGTWVDNSTIPGWYKCDGSNSTVNMVDKFVRGAATSGGSGGSDDAVVVSHTHTLKAGGVGDVILRPTMESAQAKWYSDYIGTTGVSGTDANMPAYYALIFIQRVS